MIDRINLSTYFAANYFAARQQFLNRTQRLNWATSHHEIAAKGPAGEPLLIDVAVRDGGETKPWSTIIVSSGLHGVEGFLGSAVQCACLDWIAGLPDQSKLPRLVFVHALNPFGFAWLRRCNEDNVDLNRNFMREAEGYRGAPDDYTVLDSLLNPKTPPSPWEPFQFYAMLAILRYGLPRLKRAIAAGQYEFPRGLFYGGQTACETSRFVQQHFTEWLGPSNGPVLHLDFHTGLGHSGEFELLSDLPPTKTQAERIRSVLGHAVHSNQSSAAMTYQARGSIGEWCWRQAADRDYSYLCVEFGTYSPVKVLRALRAENRAQQWDRQETETYRWAKELLKEAFCPSSDDWRQHAAEQGLNLIQRATGQS